VGSLPVICCVKRVCWCITSEGLNSLGRQEVLIVIDRLPHEIAIPNDILNFVRYLHDAGPQGTLSLLLL